MVEAQALDEGYGEVKDTAEHVVSSFQLESFSNHGVNRP